MSSFSLKANPFLILGATTRSTPSEIDTLAEFAALDGVISDSDIQKARQSLVTPRLRLLAELSWLPGLNDAVASTARDLVQRGQTVSLLKLATDLPDLARLNILAQACAEGQGSPEIVDSLAEGWDELDQAQLAIALREERAASGLPPISAQALEDGLTELRASHAGAVIDWVRASGTPGTRMTQIVEALLEWEETTFLRLLVQEYDGASDGALSDLEEQIGREVALAEAKPEGAISQAKMIDSLLVQWDQISQPMQLWAQAAGREEPRSLRVGRLVRSLAIDLTNDHDQLDASDVLVSAALRTFPELESLAQTLKEDRTALNALRKDRAQAALLEQLAAACASAKRDHGRLAAALQSLGPERARSGLLGELTGAFDRACDGLEDRAPAFALVRDLALHANNDRQDPETGFRLIRSLLLSRPTVTPPTVAKQLATDQSVLFRNWLAAGLRKAGENRRAKEALLERLGAQAPASERPEVDRLLRQLARQKVGSRIRGAFWLVVVVGVLIAIAVAGSNPPRGATTQTASLTPTSRTSAASVAAPESASGALEVMPQRTVGQGRILSRAEVRYCVFQGERLDAMYNLVTTASAIDRYNGLVDDYNARCGSFRYAPNDMAAVERDLTLRASDLRLEASRIVASW